MRHPFRIIFMAALRGAILPEGSAAALTADGFAAAVRVRWIARPELTCSRCDARPRDTEISESSLVAP
jgi:hypothetical protein